MSTASGSCRATATSCPSPSGSARKACRSTASAPPRPRSVSAGLHALLRRRRARHATSRKRWSRRAKGQRPVDAELLQVLGAAFKASKRDEEGYASLSELGQRAKAVSSFAARNYGYTRLSDLIRAVPNFEVKGGEEGGLLVKRLR